jgi:hypothetical protein
MVLLAVLWGALVQSTPAKDLSVEEIVGRVREALEIDARIEKEFTHIEQRRDVKVSKLGKFTIGPLRTFEVYPPDQPGGTSKRLIAVDGKPLSAAELVRREAEHERDLREAEARERTESAAGRAERLEKAAAEQRRYDALVSDAMRVFAAKLRGHDLVDGQRVLVADLTPRPDAHVTTREGSWMKRFDGQVWVSEANYQVVKIDMRAFDDVTIGWGIVGRIHTGSRFLFTRRYVENVWVPASLTYEASGRTLLFRPFHFSITTTYTDYKRR